MAGGTAHRVGWASHRPSLGELSQYNRDRQPYTAAGWALITSLAPRCQGSDEPEKSEIACLMDSDGSLLAFWVGGPGVPRNLIPMIVTRRLRFGMWHWLQRSTGNW